MNVNPALPGSLYKNLPSGTKLTGADWREPLQGAAGDGTNRMLPSANMSFSPSGFWGPPALTSASDTYFLDQSYGVQSQLSYFESLSTNDKAISDNLQTVDMDVSDDEDKKQTTGETNWSANPVSALQCGDKQNIECLHITDHFLHMENKKEKKSSTTSM